MEPASVSVQPRRHITSGPAGDHVTSGCGEPRPQRRTSTREKIARMVAEGTTNYPSYLKLIYTGDSEEPSSSEDELGAADRRTQSHSALGVQAARGRAQTATCRDSRATTSSVDKGRRQTTTELLESSQGCGSNCRCLANSESLSYLGIIVVVVCVNVKNKSDSPQSEVSSSTYSSLRLTSGPTMNFQKSQDWTKIPIPMLQ